MNVQEFFNKYNGQGVDFDGAYGDQCVDLYDQYCQDVVGCPIILVNGAVNIWDSHPNDSFDKIPNSPDNFPQAGDVVIWGLGIGPFGHVAIARDGDNNSFTSLDQNWNGVQHCEFVTHNYTAVLGWLRPKDHAVITQHITQPIQFTDKTLIPIGGTHGDIELQALRSMLDDKDKLDKQVVSLALERDQLINKSMKLQDALTLAQNTTKTTTIYKEPTAPTFSHPLAKLLYKAALSLG